jgi:hypothetical protein
LKSQKSVKGGKARASKKKRRFEGGAIAVGQAVGGPRPLGHARRPDRDFDGGCWTPTSGKNAPTGRASTKAQQRQETALAGHASHRFRRL